MATTKARAIQFARRSHLVLAWCALIALCLFILSALTHPLMVWTGPQAARFFPPTLTVSADSVSGLLDASRALPQGAGMQVGKVVPSESGPLFQVTRNSSEPREYYALDDTGTALADQDREQAIWLARYYSGSTAPVASTRFVDSFSAEYPWVNRLLPVYEVRFDTPDDLTLFVHTETSALGSINNNWKRGLQTVFQWFHTWSWLDDFPTLRVLVVAILLLSLLSMLIGGGVLLALLRRRSKPTTLRRLHRGLAWGVALPLAGLLISATYHLFQAEYGPAPSGMRLSPALPLAQLPEAGGDHPSLLSGRELNSLSLLAPEGRWLVRASLAQRDAKPATGGPHAHHVQSLAARERRFDGLPSERGAVFIDLMTGQRSALNDRDLALQLASEFLGLEENAALSAHLITHFGGGYDFRNKRLPVWRVDHGSDTVFIDPVTGILVEQINALQQAERLSFSLLHKWNMLVPLLGRTGRDVVVVVFLLILAGFAGMGFALRRR